MAITVNALMEEMQDTFHLKYIAGQSEGEHAVTWVHLMEDINAAELFVGNELVVTSCYACREEQALLEFVEAIHQKPIAGLVINIGKYITTIPASVIRYCNEAGIPLLTMPWEMSAMDFVKRCCVKIEKRSLEIERVNQAAMNALMFPQNRSAYESELGEFFDEDAGFLILVITTRIPDSDRRVQIPQVELRIHTALFHWKFQFLIFQLEQRFVLILNQRDQDLGRQVAEHIVSLYANRGWAELSIHIGIGEEAASLPMLAKSYHAALSASRRAEQMGRPVMCFSDMGFYKLLFSVPDRALLEEYYTQRLSPLLEYDETHEGAYVETLFRYLLNDGSLAAVAQQMYTHRNTVNYRMGKIRELLGRQLDTQQDRFPLVLAFHIGVILGKNPDYERSIVQDC